MLGDHPHGALTHLREYCWSLAFLHPLKGRSPHKSRADSVPGFMSRRRFRMQDDRSSTGLVDAASTAVKLADLAPRTTGTPYRELCSPIMFGVLAHSHPWKGPASTPLENVDAHLKSGHDAALISQLLDLVCVADVGTWSLSKHLLPTTGRSQPLWSAALQALAVPPERVITKKFPGGRCAYGR